jgi:hypothetical protein
MTAYRMIATDGNHRMIDGAAIDRFAAGLRGALRPRADFGTE